jgi:hypothetical protein
MPKKGIQFEDVHASKVKDILPGTSYIKLKQLVKK